MQLATAVMLQGMTAHYLTHSTYPVQTGDTVLIHAAAGGVGLLLVQIAKRRGTYVIGITSTSEKAELTRDFGADEVICYTEVDFEAHVQRLTAHKGVHVIYDGVDKATFHKGLNCLRPRGYMVLFGQASGPIEPFDPQILNQKGSLFLTRPSLAHYAADEAEVRQRAGDLFAWIAAGELQVRIDQTYPLAAAAAAHHYIEGRHTKGKLRLLPQDNGQPVAPEETINVQDPVDKVGWESFPASDPPPYSISCHVAYSASARSEATALFAFSLSAASPETGHILRPSRCRAGSMLRMHTKTVSPGSTTSAGEPS